MNKIILKIAKVFSGAVLFSGIAVLVISAFLVGFVRGYGFGWNAAVTKYEELLSSKVSSTSAPKGTPRPTIKSTPKLPSWGGPQLWDAVNKRRVELGVNPLKLKDNLCTIASIRLNELLELGKLDGHAGFSELAQRPDIKPIFESYSVVSEFLVQGASSPEEAVSLWENTLGHRELLSGGQYVWGCIYAQSGFGVAIAAY